MKLGYNTNGLAHHDPIQAVELLAEIGYQSVALTIDHGLLNPYSDRLHKDLPRFRDLLARYRMSSVVETGARFMLDPRQKHEPTLVSPGEQGRAKRIDFLIRAVDIAKELSSDCVSFWSGVVHEAGASEDILWQRLIEGLQPVLDHAAEQGVALGFEPEPGMFIDTMDRYGELLERLGNDRLRLTLDVGHLHCQGETPIEDVVRRWSQQLVNVHIEDMKAGVHEHLMFGEGEMDFPPIIAALREVHYRGGVHVELSRHSHMAPTAARRAMDFLRPLLDSAAT